MTAAQTFSVNVVGYVNVTIPAGFSMIANPLNNTEGNTLSNLIPDAAFGVTVYKFEPGTGFASSIFFGAWDPDLELNPGEGMFINVAEETTLTFVGEVMQGTLDNEIPAGFSIKSNIVPAAESLDDAAVGFPAEFGDTVYFFRDGGYQAVVNFGDFGGEAVPQVGESFWINKGNAATWSREFTVPE